jgi:hypothetical protein
VLGEFRFDDVSAVAARFDKDLGKELMICGFLVRPSFLAALYRAGAIVSYLHFTRLVQPDVGSMRAAVQNGDLAVYRRLEGGLARTRCEMDRVDVYRVAARLGRRVFADLLGAFADLCMDAIWIGDGLEIDVNVNALISICRPEEAPTTVRANEGVSLSRALKGRRMADIKRLYTRGQMMRSDRIIGKEWSALEIFSPGNGRMKGIEFGDFSYHKTLELVLLPDRMTEIGGWAFRECGRLKTVKFGKGLTCLGSAAFEGCVCLVEIALPMGIVEILNITFSGCRNLRKITFGNKLRMIGESGFENCRNLEEIAFPDSLKEIGAMAFSGCIAMKSVKSGSGLSILGRLAFSGCVKLQDMALPDGVKEIGSAAFRGCSSLKTLSLGRKAAALPGRGLWGMASTTCIIARS